MQIPYDTRELESPPKEALERSVPLREALDQVNVGMAQILHLARACRRAMRPAMSIRPTAALGPIVLTALLSACTTDSSKYPTLEIRPQERTVQRVEGTFQPVPAAQDERPLIPVSADLLERLSQLQVAANIAHNDFLAAAPNARADATAAQGAEIGSDEWASAQIALADLDSARSRAAISLGDLDILFVEATVGFETRAQIDNARSSIIALLTEEDAILAELRAKVR